MEAKDVQVRLQGNLSNENMQNSCIMIKNLDQDSKKDDSRIDFMENYIHQKYSEITDLQKYLVQQLQGIENSKNIKEKIITIICQHVIPTLRQTKGVLDIVKNCIGPVFKLACYYVEAISVRCKDMIIQKDLQCCKYLKELQSVKKEVKKLKEELQFKQAECRFEQYQKRNAEQTKKHIRNIIPAQQINVLAQKKETNRSVSTDKLLNHPYLLDETKKKENDRTPSKPLNNSIYNPVRSVSKEITGLQSSRKLPQARKVNITYRCEKSPTFDRISPSKSSQKQALGESKKLLKQQDLQNRKDYIKQKIQNIKSKAELFKSPHFGFK